MAGIQLSGLASGLDTQTIITQLMAAERAPRVHITDHQAADNAKESVVKDIQTKLGALNDATSALASVATWNPVQSMDSSDATKIAVSQLSGSGPGSYNVAVTQLATSDQHTYSYTPPAAASTIAIGSQSIPVAAGATVDDVVSSINSNTSAGVFAVDVNGSLVLAARSTGTANAFAATGSSLAEQTSLARPAQDAQYSVDNGPVQTSSSNVVANGIPGVQMTLKGVTTGTTISVGNPGVDQGAITQSVKSFIDAYNSALDAIRSATQEQTSSTDPSKGSMYQDTTLTSAMDALRNGISQIFSGIGNPGNMQLLSDIGISTGATTGSSAYSADSVAGKLTLDTTALTTALTSDPQSVQRLLGAASGVSGFAQSVQSTLKPYTDPGGLLDTVVTSTDSDLRDLADQLTEFDQRMTDQQTILQNQFTALETSLQSLNSQGSSLTSYINANP
jgi:flagellar hook-associated protein 2